MDTFLSICLGIGLSAACGFRVFVPLLAVSIAHVTGHLPLAHGFEWIGTYPALITLSVATVVEIAGYYIPWVDHLLDAVATPAAIAAGTLVTVSVLPDSNPLLKWSLGFIAGGGSAGLVQAATVVARGASSLTTGGLANPVLATFELLGATVGSIVSLVAPVLAVLLFLGFLVFVGPKCARKWRRVSSRPAPVAK